MRTIMPREVKTYPQCRAQGLSEDLLFEIILYIGTVFSNQVLIQ